MLKSLLSSFLRPRSRETLISHPEPSSVVGRPSYFAAAPTEQTITSGIRYGDAYRSRQDWDRQQIFTAAFRAWRLNPLARDLTRLYKIFTIDGLKISCKHKPTNEFLQALISHDTNRLPRKWPRYALELFLTGNAFTRFTVQDGGMSLIRGYPSDMIAEIETASNDIEQELSFKTSDIGADPIPAYTDGEKQTSFMLHHAINLPFGCLWGEPEIGPDLPWLERYASFLENRLRLNHFRNAYLWDVTADFTSEKERADREAQLNLHPPKPGTVNVHNSKETWQVLNPQLHSGDAEKDGISIKKLIAAGVGVPLHYLAEPESSTRTTAEAAGTPTFKTYEDAQNEMKIIISDILRTAVKVRSRTDSKVSPDEPIDIQTADPTERDNATLGLAVSRVTLALTELFDRELITSAEFLRLIYRFGGETLPADFIPPTGKRRPLTATPGPSPTEEDPKRDPSDPLPEPTKP